MRAHFFLENVHVECIEPLSTPRMLHRRLPGTEAALSVVSKARHELARVLRGEDSRLVVVVGPCSIHDPHAALDYAERLNALRQELQSRLLIIMRTYFEKPRTMVGWKGFINDPRLDDSFDIEEGLYQARKLLLAVNEMGLACGTEALDPLIPQYVGDLIAWNAIGARTTESQTHREMASGLSTPVGFKNGTDGSLDVALNAMMAASRPHNFLGVDSSGLVSIVRTRGNPNGHLILRGGTTPNYHSANIAMAQEELRRHGLNPRVMVDCSHGNSHKDYRRQPEVFESVLQQRLAGNTGIFGVMLESHLVEGRQDLKPGAELCYGQSITDACIGWGVTEELLREAARRL
jgi:3-deoxy-7-phosphoheptulonate synthase